MNRSALLIDLENFVRSREEKWDISDGEYDPKPDIESLNNFVVALNEGSRLIVKRAYADYTASFRQRKADGTKITTYKFYPELAHTVMEHGIEPIQVFRLARKHAKYVDTQSKNAADMRMAMDAGALTVQNADVDQVIMITGDGDFVPVCLEMRRRGVEVIVIGVNGSTNSAIRPFCDSFYLFEDLVAVHSPESERDDRLADVRLAEVRTGLHSLLQERGGVIKFAAVKPLLSQRLKQGFEPERFDCSNAGGFVERYADRLGVVVVRGDHDKEVHLPASAGASAEGLADDDADRAGPSEEASDGPSDAPSDGDFDAAPEQQPTGSAF